MTPIAEVDRRIGRKISVPASPNDSTIKPIRTSSGKWTVEEIRRMPMQGFQKTLGIDLLVVKPCTIRAEIRITDENRNSVGGVHGGVIMALADSLGAMGALQHLAADQFTATIESKTNFVGAARGNIIRGNCTPLHIGQRTSVWVTKINSEDGRLVAVVTQTQLHFCKS